MGQRQRAISMQTLKPEVSPGDKGIPVGQAIPSHLRMGVYHDPSVPGTTSTSPT